MATEDFDEDGYLERYSDVARAVDQGAFPSGWDHFDRFGRAEGRSGTRLFVPEQVGIDPTLCIMTILSPALVSAPPVVINQDKIPDDLRRMYASLWRQEPSPWELSCYLLKDVIVIGDGLVFDMAGRLVAESAHQTSKRQIEQAAIKVKDYLSNGADISIGGTTILCEKIGVVNYGHWLVEMAPIVYLLRKQIKTGWFVRAPLVEDAAGMSTVIRDTLDLLSIDPARIRWGTNALPQRYERLVMVCGFSQHGVSYSPLASTAMSEMAARVAADRPCRIWVSRADMQRKMQDETSLCEALAARGWTIVYPGSISLRRKISLFKNAEVVAGVSGAGLTNIGFAPTSAQIIVFVPARMPDIFFWAMAQMKGQSYTEIRCSQEHADHGAFNWDGALMMETAEALAHIDAIISP